MDIKKVIKYQKKSFDSLFRKKRKPEMITIKFMGEDITILDDTVIAVHTPYGRTVKPAKNYDPDLDTVIGLCYDNRKKQGDGMKGHTETI